MPHNLVYYTPCSGIPNSCQKKTSVVTGAPKKQYNIPAETLTISQVCTIQDNYKSHIFKYLVEIYDQLKQSFNLGLVVFALTYMQMPR